jgi:glutamate-1-semialdehyde 2,1-aminomutase
VSQIEQTFLRRTPNSAKDVERRNQCMPAGNTRAMVQYAPYPVILERGAGALVWDSDGNEYIDLNYNYATLLHGHAYPPIVDAVTEQIRNGSLWATPAPQQILLAEELSARVPTVERVRFCNSGTEANMLAARMVRAITGRDLLLKAQFGFHGSYPDLLSGTPFDDLRSNPGGETRTRAKVATYGDADSFERVLTENQGSIAAVFIEPFMFAAGVVPPPEGFLTRLEEVTHAAGALLVLDEVVSLRFARGGAQSLYGLTPDLTVMGKTIGGGFPMGAVGGPAAHMNYLDPSGPAKISHPHSGTFNGHLASCVAGLVALQELTADRIAGMTGSAQTIQAHIEDAARSLGLPIHVSRAGSILNVYFLPELPRVPVLRGDAELIRLFHLACLNHGLFISPKGMMAMACVLTDDLLQDISGRLTDALTDIANHVAQSPTAVETAAV